MPNELDKTDLAARIKHDAALTYQCKDTIPTWPYAATIGVVVINVNIGRAYMETATESGDCGAFMQRVKSDQVRDISCFTFRG